MFLSLLDDINCEILIVLIEENLVLASDMLPEGTFAVKVKLAGRTLKKNYCRKNVIIAGLEKIDLTYYSRRYGSAEKWCRCHTHMSVSEEVM